MKTALMLLLAASLSGTIEANPVSKTIDSQNAALSDSRHSQRKIDTLDQATQQDLQQYRQLLQQINNEQRYQSYLQQMVTSQQQELEQLQQQQQAIEQTKTDIVPFIQQQLDELTRLVDQDLPFLSQERSQRIQQLYLNMSRADVSLAEKFKQLLSRYLVEAEYGQTLQQYSGELSTEQGTLAVRYLRIGRLAYYYQTDDGQRSAIWNSIQQQWQPLDPQYNPLLTKAIAIAAQSRQADVMTLPIFKMLSTTGADHVTP